MPYTDSTLGTNYTIWDKDPATGYAVRVSGSGIPPTTASVFAPGCQYTDTSAYDMYINEGTTASPSWNSVADIGAADIGTGAVTSAKIAAEAVTMAKLARGTNGQIIVANTGADPAYVTMSGDATLSAAGALTVANLAISTAKLAADAVDNTKLADNAVSLENIDAAAKPILITVAAGIFTTAGGDANESITATGTLGTDTAIVWVQKAGATPRTVDTITPGTDSIAVVLSGDPSTDHKLGYTVYRAAA